jgi:hypothetical protein
MKRPATGRLLGPLLGVLLALPAVGIVAPTPARAGCSSQHLTFGTPSNGSPAGLELLFARAATAPARHDTAPRDLPRPCSGALCSGNPAPPVSTAPSLASSGGGQWAFFATVIPPASPGPRLHPRLDPALQPVDRNGSVFHPPRHSS